MKLSQLYPKKSSAPKKSRGGLTPEQAAAIEQEFNALMEPLDEKATQFFRCFSVNGKLRFWLLPSCETWRDLPFEKMKNVLAYKNWYVTEISKVELDSIPYEFPSNASNEAAQHLNQ